MNEDIRAMQAEMERLGYITEPAIATAVYLAKEMQKPLLVEGEAGVGKTEIAKCSPAALDRTHQAAMLRGLDTNTALYEWNYQRQLLRLRIAEREARDPAELEDLIFGREYLLERPLLARDHAPRRPGGPADRRARSRRRGLRGVSPEVLSDFQITIPELGRYAPSTCPWWCSFEPLARDR